MLSNKKGFTLIELLIVVVIIGILAAIAIPKFANTKQKAYIASMKADLRNLVTAEEAYFADNTTYGGVTSTGDGVASGGDLGAVYSSSAGVSVTATATGGEGFIATATHSGAAGISCQIAVGKSAVAPLVEGEPSCTP